MFLHFPLVDGANVGVDGHAHFHLAARVVPMKTFYIDHKDNDILLKCKKWIPKNKGAASVCKPP